MAVLAVTERQETRSKQGRWITGLLGAATGTPTVDSFKTGLNFVRSCKIQCVNAASDGRIFLNTADAGSTVTNGTVTVISATAGDVYRYLAEGY